MNKKEFKAEQLKAFRVAVKLLTSDPDIEPSLLAGLLGYWGLDANDPIYNRKEMRFTIPVDEHHELDLVIGMRPEILEKAIEEFNVPFRDGVLVTLKYDGEPVTHGHSLCSVSDEPDPYVGAHVALRKATSWFPRKERKQFHNALNRWFDSEVQENFLEVICSAL